MSKITDKQQRELQYLAELSDEDIDTSDIPEVDYVSDAVRGRFYRPIKRQITLRIDTDVLEWFRAQGGSVSPILANIYLHYALDVWFEETVRARCRGAVYLCRYADDFVCAFELEVDAERFYNVLGSRLEKFGLEVAAEKTNLIRFSPVNWKASGAFEFLGFEFRWGLGRWRKPVIKRRTARKKYRAALASFQEWCRENCRLPKDKLFAKLNSKLRGYNQYYGVRGNYDSLQAYFYHVTRILYKTLNRRSQRRSYNWRGFTDLIKVFKLRKPRICRSQVGWASPTILRCTL